MIRKHDNVLQEIKKITDRLQSQIHGKSIHTNPQTYNKNIHLPPWQNKKITRGMKNIRKKKRKSSKNNNSEPTSVIFSMNQYDIKVKCYNYNNEIK